MKYHLFAGNTYYAKGGVHDYQMSSDSIEGLVKFFEASVEGGEYWDWYHIIDSDFQIVKEDGRAHY